MNGRYLRWLLSHIDEVQSIYLAYQVAIAEPKWAGRLRAMTPVLNALAEIMDDFPEPGIFGAGDSEENANELEAAESEATARNIDWQKVVQIAALILKLLAFADPKQQ